MGVVSSVAAALVPRRRSVAPTARERLRSERACGPRCTELARAYSTAPAREDRKKTVPLPVARERRHVLRAHAERPRDRRGVWRSDSNQAHGVEQVDRFLSNTAIDVARLTPSWARSVLAARKELALALSNQRVGCKSWYAARPLPDFASPPMRAPYSEATWSLWGRMCAVGRSRSPQYNTRYSRSLGL